MRPRPNLCVPIRIERDDPAPIGPGAVPFLGEVDHLAGRPHDRLDLGRVGHPGQLVQLIAEGRTTKEVAQILGMSVKTAEFHRSRLMEKLDIHETASLVRYAIRKGIVQA